MKFPLAIAGLTATLLTVASCAQARVTIDPAIRVQIADILSKPVQVFDLDLDENDKIFEHLDRFFGQFTESEGSKSTRTKRRDRDTLRARLPKNIPISPTGKALVTREPVNVWYIREPQRRTFMKEVRVPSHYSLPEDEVVQIGKSFIVQNKLCRITDKDRLGRHLVGARERQALKLDLKETDKMTISQNVGFKREFLGMEVLNSKQIVEIHPDSGEVISYKNIQWTPVDETSGKTMPYLSFEEVIGEIESVFLKSKVSYKITEVKPGVYQTDKMIFPVLAVYSQRQPERADMVPIKEVLIINLVKVSI